jgi:predicted DNA-binding transcriptional regulator AlpA
MYIYENDLAASQVPIHRKRIGPAAGGGEKAYVDFEARPFSTLENGDLIDTADLCRIFGCSLRTVYRWMSHHALRPVRKAGRDFLFTKGDILRWYAEHQPRPGRPPIGGRG